LGHIITEISFCVIIHRTLNGAIGFYALRAVPGSIRYPTFHTCLTGSNVMAPGIAWITFRCSTGTQRNACKKPPGSLLAISFDIFREVPGTYWKSQVFFYAHFKVFFSHSKISPVCSSMTFVTAWVQFLAKASLSSVYLDSM